MNKLLKKASDKTGFYIMTKALNSANRQTDYLEKEFKSFTTAYFRGHLNPMLKGHELGYVYKNLGTHTDTLRKQIKTIKDICEVNPSLAKRCQKLQHRLDALQHAIVTFMEYQLNIKKNESNTKVAAYYDESVNGYRIFTDMTQLDKFMSTLNNPTQPIYADCIESIRPLFVGENIYINTKTIY